MTTEKQLFEFLFQPGEAVEVRVVEPWCGSGFFDNPVDLQEALEELDATKPVGIYCTLNPVTREAFERAPNQFRRAVRGRKLACSGADIASRRWILIDSDAIRPKGVSATDEEKRLAMAKNRTIRDSLVAEGAPAMVEADSGNGGHLLLPCNLPNDKESTQLVRGFLEFLSARFSDEHVKVDTVNFNPDRITKAYGTWARKGPHTPNRPHRRSGILSLPAVAVPVPREFLERMQLSGRRTADTGFADQQIEKLKSWSRTVPDFPGIKRIKRETGKVIVIPEYCYLNPDHQGTSAGITFHADGGRGNACKHDGCNLPFKKWWQEVEKLYGQPLRFDPEIILGTAAPAASDWTLQNYSAIKVESVSWIFPHYLARGKPTGLVGEPGEGKSLLTIEWASRITTGRGFPDGAEAIIPPSSVLMLNSEDGEADTIKPRFLLAGGDPTRLYQLKLPIGSGFYIDNDEDVKRLGEQLTVHPEIACIMIDPVLQHALSEKEQDVRRGVANLRALLAERGVALLFVAHFNKMSIKNLSSPLDKLSGAKAWTGLPRFVFALMRNPQVDPELGKSRHHLICAKSNLGANDLPAQDFTIEGQSTKGGLNVGSQPVIRWIGESFVTMRDILNDQGKKADKPSALDEAIALLECELMDTPRPATEIIAVLDEAGVTEKTRQRAKAKLFFCGAMARAENIGGIWHWKKGDSPRLRGSDQMAKP